MLVSAGWAVQDAKAVNLYAKQGVAIRARELKYGSVPAEYLLCNSIDLTPRISQTPIKSNFSRGLDNENTVCNNTPLPITPIGKG
jgi:hypothetical protein